MLNNFLIQHSVGIRAAICFVAYGLSAAATRWGPKVALCRVLSSGTYLDRVGVRLYRLNNFLIQHSVGIRAAICVVAYGLSAAATRWGPKVALCRVLSSGTYLDRVGVRLYRLNNFLIQHSVGTRATICFVAYGLSAAATGWEA